MYSSYKKKKHNFIALFSMRDGQENHLFSSHGSLELQVAPR